MKIFGYYITKRDEVASLKETIKGLMDESGGFTYGPYPYDEPFFPVKSKRPAALRAANMTPEELEKALAIPQEHPVFQAVMRIFDQHIEDQVSELEKPVNATNPYVSSFLQGGLNALRDLRDKIEVGRSRAYGRVKVEEKKPGRQAL